MEYAINKSTGMLESAVEASRWGWYECPVCKTKVSRRSGEKRKPYFAHWPGLGSSVCENFVPGQHLQHSHDQDSASKFRQRMELRLLISRGREHAGWSVELVIPPCRKCQATVSLDVGGRIQTLDMRGMDRRRYVTAELSIEPYRIVNFSGDPDLSFVFNVERECPGLPAFGAAVFTASRDGDLKGFPRAQSLRSSETFAFLWSKPIEFDFPNELMVDKLCGRQGWNLALVTIPDDPSEECIDWLCSFTGLPIVSSTPSIIPIWPFLTRKSSINEIECVKSGIVLFSAEMMPVKQWDLGPTIQAQSSSAKHFAVGVARSPAFFALKSEGTAFVELAEASTPDIKEFISFSLRPDYPQGYPAVELAFATSEGIPHIVPLHQRKCTEVAVEARMQGVKLEYLSMPLGAKGSLLIDGPTGRSRIPLFSGIDTSPHNRNMRLLPLDILEKLKSALADFECYIEIKFGGFGCLRLVAGTDKIKLAPALRTRLLSFMYQLRLATPSVMYADDAALVEALAAARPEPPLIPHYRSLVKEVFASGFELKCLRGNVLL